MGWTVAGVEVHTKRWKQSELCGLRKKIMTYRRRRKKREREKNIRVGKRALQRKVEDRSSNADEEVKK